MPRVDNNRGVAIPYRPGFPGAGAGTQEEQMRAIWDELTRIAIATAAIDQPVSVGATVAGLIPVQPTVIWTRLFDADFVGDPWATPSDSLDVQTGVYTVPTEGVYVINMQLTIDAFATPQVKDYYAGIRLTVSPVDGVPASVFSYSGGPDTVPVSVLITWTGAASQGTAFAFDGTVVHEQVTGTTDYRATLSVVRMSGIGDNTA